MDGADRMSAEISFFQIQRATNSQGPWQNLFVVGGSASSYIDNQVIADVGYFYRVRARNISGWGPFSNVVLLTPSSGVPIVAPTGETFNLTSCGEEEAPVGGGFGLQEIIP